jgi:hypothetical protein
MRVFISYSMTDGQNIANSVADMLKDDFKAAVFLASHNEEDIIGRQISEVIRYELDQSHHVLVIFTPKALKSAWVLGEADYALRKGKKLTVCVHSEVEIEEIPLTLQTAGLITFTDHEELLESLRKLKWGIPVVIPTAGEGSGLFPFSIGMPKTLFPIREKPILYHIIDRLDPTIFSSVIVVSGRFMEMESYYVDLLKTDIPVKCVKTRGKTLPLAIKALGLKTPFLLHYSDIIIEGNVDWGAFVRQHENSHREHKVIGTLMTSKKYKIDVGRIIPHEVHPQLISSFAEKPDQLVGYSINMAVSIFEPELLDLIGPNDSSLYGDTVTRAMEAGYRFSYYGHDKWLHIQSLNDWLIMQEKYFG